MRNQLDEFARTLDRRMDVLDGLTPARAADARIVAIKAMLEREAVRRQRQRRVLAFARRWGGVAAALVLAAAWTWAQPAGPRVGGNAMELARQDAAQQLNDWENAVEDSSEQMAALLMEEWQREAVDTPDDEAFEDFFRSLDRSLGIGA